MRPCFIFTHRETAGAAAWTVVDDAVAKPKSPRARPSAAAAIEADTPLAVTQRDDARCSPQASGKNRAEHKDFMQTCRSTKVKPAAIAALDHAGAAS
jgi:hypothetical protein